MTILAGAFAAADDKVTDATEASDANRREFMLSTLEKDASEMAMTQVVLRQIVLDEAPEISRKKCDRIALKMRDPAYFKLARERIKTLEKRKHHSKLSPDQLDRLANVKERIDFLEENAEMPCASLAPLNP